MTTFPNNRRFTFIMYTSVPLLLEQMIMCIFAIYKATGKEIRRGGGEDEDSVEE